MTWLPYKTVSTPKGCHSAKCMCVYCIYVYAFLLVVCVVHHILSKCVLFLFYLRDLKRLPFSLFPIPIPVSYCKCVVNRRKAVGGEQILREGDFFEKSCFWWDQRYCGFVRGKPETGPKLGDYYGQVYAFWVWLIHTCCLSSPMTPKQAWISRAKVHFWGCDWRDRDEDSDWEKWWKAKNKSMNERSRQREERRGKSTANDRNSMREQREGVKKRRREWLSIAFQEQREQRLFCVEWWESEVEPGLRECLTVYTDCIPAMWLQDVFNLYSGNGLNSLLSLFFFTLNLHLFPFSL